MSADLAGRTVLITGAGSGIGQAHAVHFAALGCHVIAHDISHEALAGTLALVPAAAPFACDVCEADRFEEGVRALDSVRAIDALVNNVGIAGDGPMDVVTPDFVDLVFKVNVGGTIAATRGVIAGMKARRAGRIVNTSSNWGVFGHADSSIYAASKAAILGLTKSWALEFAPWGITVNAIAPGGIETALLETSPERLAGIPLRRHGRTDEVAKIAAFLASDAAAYMTGTVMHLNGGENLTG
ncbi:SDR family NAD(P)-dependent oxidoreductase [Ancylobacter mangrovi]|uniref:SDR family NAD(P)-dependent oxidoreductase n=1 Tax=Ancylobacter mangrovi TaxID=2972472 RepID=UPI00216295A5|nr:SDR family NAD(P)-dependent oxidoreductase [Ancylobacter mangrovi]MCS0504634.1 SDR family oxidoreductase [Ancylobacter mangrovi]